MTKTKLLLLLVLLMTTATGAWAQTETSAKHRITATLTVMGQTKTKVLEEPLPYQLTLSECYTAVMGSAPNTNFIVSDLDSDNKGVVYIGTPSNSWNSPISVIADGEATVSLKMMSIPVSIAISVVSPFYVALKSGTKDAAKWTATVGSSTTAQTLPVGGLSMGDAVTLNYTGRLRVKKVTATTDLLATPLTMEVTQAGTIFVDIEGSVTATSPFQGLKYSINGGEKQTIIDRTTIGDEVEGLPAGTKVQFYGNGTRNTAYGILGAPSVNFAYGTAKVKVYGNIMSLIDEENFATNYTTLPDGSNTFCGLFGSNTNLTDASGLLLPATTLVPECYTGMFNSCTNLTKAPKLPATTLADNCYDNMFYGCQSLTKAPVLPAPTLVYRCYREMFDNCTSLSSITCLATDISAEDCTSGWVGNVAASGTFTKAAAADWSSMIDTCGIPEGWTVEDAQ